MLRDGWEGDGEQVLSPKCGGIGGRWTVQYLLAAWCRSHEPPMPATAESNPTTQGTPTHIKGETAPLCGHVQVDATARRGSAGGCMRSSLTSTGRVQTDSGRWGWVQVLRGQPAVPPALTFASATSHASLVEVASSTKPGMAS